MREGRIAPAPAITDLLLRSADAVTRMLDSESQGTAAPAELGVHLIEGLQAIIDGKEAAAPAPASSPVVAIPVLAIESPVVYHIRYQPARALFSKGGDPLPMLSALANLGEVTVETDVSALPDLIELDPTHCHLSWNIRLTSTHPEETIREAFDFLDEADVLEFARETPVTAVASMAVETVPEIKASETMDAKVHDPKTEAKTAVATSIRVDLEKVDRLVNMVGELVITEAMLRDQVRHLSPDLFSRLLRGIDELSHHTRELQEAVMAVRMQPVKSVFSRMPRIVRDAASSLGKDIQLVLIGENTEVDKTVIELLGDPLTHMIRNSVDHGIETPDQRAWNDKPLQGTIRLSAYHQSGRIFIEIADDGAGINRGRVLDKAREKGLVSKDAQLTDEEIDHLIFLPGFSTAETVTSLSGRGVGMDVVRRNIEALGGTVRITNRPGLGSTFAVSLPLTLAILDGMIVRIGAENYIVPITSIIETMRPKEGDVRHVEGRADVINVRGEFVPLVHLHRLFGIESAQKNTNQSLIVLVESGMQKLGLVVDELIGQQQVVIKSLEANADPVKGISGATILGDGKVSLILEVNELKELAQQQTIPLVRVA